MMYLYNSCIVYILLWDVRVNCEYLYGTLFVVHRVHY